MGEPEEMTGHESTAIRDPLVGASVLGYRILRPIGVGGMGKVYEAEEPNIGRRAAVKVLLPEVAQHPEFVARLKAEARAANAARHRGIVDIFGFGELPDGRQAIIMEYLEGVPLDEELHRLAREGRRLPTLQTLGVLDEIAAVLQAAHAASVTHRDLKPSNIFLCASSDGSQYVKVLDFGIAKVDSMKNSPKTATNTIMGTAHYMAPEQAAGDPAAASMDLYALGVIAFELFTGQLPFDNESIMALLLAHQQTPPPVPSTVAPGLPKVVDDFVLKLLEKRPGDRFLSGAEVRVALQQLRRVLGDVEAMPTDKALPAAPPPTAISERRPRPLRGDTAAVQRSSGPMVAVGVGALGLVAALAFVLWPRPAPAPPTPGPLPALVAPPVAVVPEAPPTPAPEVVQAAVAPPLPPEPTVAAKPEPTATPLESRRRKLERRLGTLGTKLATAARRGESVTLASQQLEALRSAFKTSRDVRTLDQIETALQRLEGEAP